MHLRNLSFLPGHTPERHESSGKLWSLIWNFLREKERINCILFGSAKLGGIVKRIVFALGIAALTCAAAVVIAQEAPAKKPAQSKHSSANSAAVAKGKDIFDKKCGICHYANSDQKKIGPGLKGIGKRGTFSVNNNKVTDETLKTWIENGDSLMPPFKDVLDAQQIKDVIAYVKTL